MSKKGFTLAEVMIAFVVVSILAAILIPALFTATPDQYKLKAKKAYNTLNRAVEYLTNSGPYDVTGGSLDASAYIHEANDENAKKRFFCNNLAEVLNVKYVDCTDSNDRKPGSKISTAASCLSNGSSANSTTTESSLCIATTDTNSNSTTDKKLDYDTLKNRLDEACKEVYTEGHNLETADGVYWIIEYTDFSNSSTVEVDGITTPAHYGIICIDTAKSANEDYVYGIGLRKDGRIIAGAKLQELLEENDNE